LALPPPTTIEGLIERVMSIDREVVRQGQAQKDSDTRFWKALFTALVAVIGFAFTLAGFLLEKIL